MASLDPLHSCLAPPFPIVFTDEEIVDEFLAATAHFESQLKKSLLSIDGSGVTFKKQLSSRGVFSSIFIVEWQGENCLIKVHKNLDNKENLDKTCAVHEDRKGGEVLLLGLSEKECEHVVLLKGVIVVDLENSKNMRYCKNIDEISINNYIIASIFPYCKESQDLEKYISSLNRIHTKRRLSIIQNIAKSCLEAIAFLHENNIAHRDIKPDNILRDPRTGNVQLIDFGFAIALEKDERTDSPAGAIAFRAPEAKEKRPYNHKCDIWSLGLVIYELVTKKYLSKHSEIDIDTDPVLKINPEIQRFLKSLLEVDPTKRPTAKEALEFPFVHPEREKEEKNLFLEYQFKPIKSLK